ncbi:hypothetical protein [Leuconostoc falkenbergense]|uniref:hypothetical protein n=1 Tax=Leuconostoc falkenbergense TaxID=2766470 RepID=UPI0024A9F696|nr:hypothetical protein [Leuconostoc falkenbergense]MDI6553507.1 hypothetical protein [Leuconostoc falkenbergense]
MTVKDVKSQELEVPAGYFFLVSMTTQAGYAIEVTIAEQNEAIIFDARRQSNNPLPVISNTFVTTMDNPILTIRCDESADLDVRFDRLQLTDDNDNLISGTYTFVAEDCTDRDYNDLFLTVSAWRYQG